MYQNGLNSKIQSNNKWNQIVSVDTLNWNSNELALHSNTFSCMNALTILRYFTESIHSFLFSMKNEWKKRYEKEFQNLISMQLIECNDLYVIFHTHSLTDLTHPLKTCILFEYFVWHIHLVNSLVFSEQCASFYGWVL